MANFIAPLFFWLPSPASAFAEEAFDLSSPSGMTNRLKLIWDSLVVSSSRAVPAEFKRRRITAAPTSSVNFEAAAQFFHEHLATPIQDEHRAFANRLALDIAKALLPEPGTFAMDLLPLQFQNVHHAENPPHPYELTIRRVLTKLRESESLRAKLAAITKPASPEAPANALIRLTLGLGKEHAVTDLDAQRTALHALLSHPRQGSAGSCFANVVLITLHEANLEQCLDDFAELLAFSRLRRVVNGTPMDFPFLLYAPGEKLQNNIMVNSLGQIKFANGVLQNLWESPGLLAALSAASIDNAQESIVNAIKDGFKPLDFSTWQTMTCEQLIRDVVTYVSARRHHIMRPTADIVADAFLAFEAQTNCLLQVMWYNAVAGMAKVSDKASLKFTLLQFIQKKLESRLSELDAPAEVCTVLFEAISDLFQRHTSVLFHSYMYEASPAESIPERGFYLIFENGMDPDPRKWHRIHNVASLVNFLDTLLTKINRQQEVVDPNLICKLRRFIRTERFNPGPAGKLREFVHHAGSRSQQMKTREQDLFLDSGAYCGHVLEVYLKNSPTVTKMTRRCYSAKEFLDLILYEKKIGVLSQNKRTIISLSEHVCTLLPGHPDLESVSSFRGISAREQAGKQIANTSLKQDAVAGMLEKFKNNQVFGPFHSRFDELARILTAARSKIDIRGSVAAFVETLPLDAPMKEKTMLDFDEQLYAEGLTTEEKFHLIASSIIFADSNWYQGPRNEYFCFVVSPGTGKWEVWKILDDRSVMSPMTQYTYPLEIILSQF